MAIFQEDLKPEEKISGFSVDEIDNDIFLAETLEESEVDILSSGNELDNKNSEEKLADNGDYRDIASLEDTYNNTSVTTDDDNSSTFDSSNDSNIDTYTNSDSSIMSEETVEFDESFLDMLRADIERQRGGADTTKQLEYNFNEEEVVEENITKEEAESQISGGFDIFNDENYDINSSQTEIEETETDTVQSYKDMFAVAPSDDASMDLEPAEIKEPEHENFTEGATENHTYDMNTPLVEKLFVGEKEEKEEKNKENKETPSIRRGSTNPIKVIAIVTAASIVILLGGIFGFYYFKNANNNQIISEAPPAESTKETNNSVEDSLVANQQETGELNNTDVDSNSSENIITEQLADSTISSTISVVDQPYDNKSTANKISSNKITTTTNSTTTSTNTSTKTNINTNTNTINNKPQPQAKQVISENRTSLLVESKKNIAEEVHSVQIYASPNRDDAEKRLVLLKEKNIHSGYISTQTVKGKTWYRVRFGNYNSYDAAYDAATVAGFTQFWVDRIK